MKADVIKEQVHPRQVNPDDLIYHENVLRTVVDRYGIEPNKTASGHWNWRLVFSDGTQADFYDGDEDNTVTRLAAVIRL